jgi:hypothetical protein
MVIRVTVVGEGPRHMTLEMMLTPWDEPDRQGPESSKPSDPSAGKITGSRFFITEFSSLDAVLARQRRFSSDSDLT